MYLSLFSFEPPSFPRTSFVAFCFAYDSSTTDLTRTCFFFSGKKQIAALLKIVLLLVNLGQSSNYCPLTYIRPFENLNEVTPSFSGLEISKEI